MKQYDGLSAEQLIQIKWALEACESKRKGIEDSLTSMDSACVHVIDDVIEDIRFVGKEIKFMVKELELALMLLDSNHIRRKQ